MYTCIFKKNKYIQFSRLTILLKFSICLIRFKGKIFNKNICVKQSMHTNQSGYILCLTEKSIYTDAFIPYVSTTWSNINTLKVSFNFVNTHKNRAVVRNVNFRWLFVYRSALSRAASVWHNNG